MPTAIIDGITTRYEVLGSGPPLLMYSPAGFNAAIETWRTQSIYAQVGSGEIAASPEFQRHVMGRLFAADAAERRAFTEGLAAGNRVRELFDQQAARNTTDATGVYLLLWLYWPEIAALRSVGQAAQLLERLFGPNRNLAGRHWEERFRKLSNRIGLSFRAKQQRRRQVART